MLSDERSDLERLCHHVPNKFCDHMLSVQTVLQAIQASLKDESAQHLPCHAMMPAQDQQACTLKKREQPAIAADSKTDVHTCNMVQALQLHHLHMPPFLVAET